MKQDANEIPKSLSGTLKFSNPAVKEETKHTPEFDYEFVNDALNFYFNYSQKELLKNTLGDIERKNLEAIRQKSLYHMSNNDYYSAVLKENQELKALNDDLLEALKSIKALIDNNTLVRNTENDGLEGFAIRQLPLITALAKMQRAINKHESL